LQSLLDQPSECTSLRENALEITVLWVVTACGLVGG